MTDAEKCIKLAEFVGWQELDHTPGRWFNDAYPQEECRATEHLPNPLTDANACNALIKHLNGLGYDVTIICWYEKKQGVRLVHPHGNNLQWQGDNWMHGVYELALKMIDNDDD